MKKNEWITLGVGIVVIIFFAWVGGIFNIFSSQASSTTQTMSQQSKNAVPEVIGKNISSDPKLQIIEVQAGTSTIVAKTGSHVYVHYTGYLENGTVFDSSISRGQPIDFVLGQGAVIKGWDLGLQGMKVGGKRRLIIAPDYAYGAAGAGGGVIPGNATLIFDVELVSVK